MGNFFTRMAQAKLYGDGERYQVLRSLGPSEWVVVDSWADGKRVANFETESAAQAWADAHNKESEK